MPGSEWQKSTYSGGGNGACIEVAFDWQKSSFSGGGNGECLEVAAEPAGLLLRESDRPDDVLAVSRRRFAALLGGIKAGEFGSQSR